MNHYFSKACICMSNLPLLANGAITSVVSQQCIQYWRHFPMTPWDILFPAVVSQLLVGEQNKNSFSYLLSPLQLVARDDWTHCKVTCFAKFVLCLIGAANIVLRGQTWDQTTRIPSENVCLWHANKEGVCLWRKKLIYLKCMQQQTHTHARTHPLWQARGGQSQPEGTGHSRLYIITITHAGTKSLHTMQHTMGCITSLCLCVCVCVSRMKRWHFSAQISLFTNPKKSNNVPTTK